MFRKQGIDISSRGSFELPARLRIIVRVLSRSCTPFAFYPFPFSVPFLHGLLPSFDAAIALRIVHATSFPSVVPVASSPRRTRTTGQFIRQDTRFISFVAIEMQLKGCVLRANDFLCPSFPSFACFPRGCSCSRFFRLLRAVVFPLLSVSRCCFDFRNCYYYFF